MTISGLVYGALAAVLFTLVSSTPRKFGESFFEGGSEIIYRLPTAVVPDHYNIAIVPTFLNGSSSFSGDVTIDMTVNERTNVIIVHSDELTIHEWATTVTSITENRVIDIVTQNYDQLRKFYILTFRDLLPLGTYNVTFSFDGQLARDMYGFYQSFYRVGGETRTLVTTQFQPTAARRAFPCFDEPGLKANFDIRIAHFLNQTALSNMPNISTSGPDASINGRVWTQFQTTPVMSTNILAFMVLDFESVTSADGLFSIWTQPEALNTTAWALQTSVLTHTIISRLTLTNDSWPKIDQVAVPDHLAGAMENWGLVTYRKEFLLWQEGESNTRSRERVAKMIAHELAHSWFGNLVSPRWWDHLWFSEGFATYYQFLIPSLSNWTWRYTERIVTDQQLPSMIADSLETTRSMTSIVGSRSSILANFDNVAYQKSAAVLRMLNRVMREDLFSRALETFFNASAHGTFEPEVLWSHMQAIADVNTAVHNHTSISAIMNSWTEQPGYPLVTVLRNYSTTVAAFSQERFFMDPSSPTADPESQRWWIPITFAIGTVPTRCNGAWIQPDWLRAQDKAIMMSGVPNDTWILGNCQAIGYYRTNYDTRNWELLTEFLKGPDYAQINAINRGILIDDSFNLARSGYINYSIPLSLSTYLANDDDFVVWRTAIPAFSYLTKILRNHAYSSQWQVYQRNLISNLSESLGWDVNSTDTHEIRLHREQILNLACQVNAPGARASAVSRFNLWITDPQLNPVDPDLRSVVYCWGVSTASEATWDIVWNRFLTTNLATEAELLLQSLACSQNPTILERYLQLSISPNSGIRVQDRSSVFTMILNSERDNIELLLNFFSRNTEAISESYGGPNVAVGILSDISSRITTQNHLAQFRSVANTIGTGVNRVAVERALQSANENLQWISNNAPDIQGWLDEQGIVADTNVDGGAAAITSSLLFIFISVVMVMSKNFQL